MQHTGTRTSSSASPDARLPSPFGRRVGDEGLRAAKPSPLIPLPMGEGKKSVRVCERFDNSPGFQAWVNDQVKKREPALAGDREAPKARNVTAWADGLGTCHVCFVSEPQRGEIISRSIHDLRFYVAPSELNSFLGRLPGAVPQAFALRAFGACERSRPRQRTT